MEFFVQSEQIVLFYHSYAPDAIWIHDIKIEKKKKRTKIPVKLNAVIRTT